MKLFSRSRSSLANRVPPGALRTYLSTAPPDPSTPLAAARLLAIDMETTGLDPATDHVLSVGFVPVDGELIQLSGAREILVRPEGEVGESARFHGLTDDSLLPGVGLADALEGVLSALTGRVLLAHHAALEGGFLAQACETLYGVRPSFDVVDTMSLQYSLLSQGYDDEPPQGSLRLWAARGQYGLPRYAAHAALTDALACAELYLAQIAELQTTRARTLKSVLKG